VGAPIKRPEKHRVAGAILSIKWEPKGAITQDGDHCFGVTANDTHDVRIEDGLPPFLERDTLMHELLHVLIRRGKLDIDEDEEEKVCELLGTALVGHIQDNPTFWRFMTKKVDK